MCKWNQLNVLRISWKNDCNFNWKSVFTPKSANLSTICTVLVNPTQNFLLKYISSAVLGHFIKNKFRLIIEFNRIVIFRFSLHLIHISHPIWIFEFWEDKNQVCHSFIALNHVPKVITALLTTFLLSFDRIFFEFRPYTRQYESVLSCLSSLCETEIRSA